MPKAPQPDRRIGTLRRQANEAFCAPDGSFSITKTIAIAAQIVLLYHLGKDFDDLSERFDAFALTLVFLILPDMAKKLLTMKYGNGKP